MEYPCHSPDRQRWFQLRVSRLDHEGRVYAVLVHHEISERVLIEQEREHYLARARWHQEQLRTLAAASARIAAAGTPEATFQEIADEARLIIGARWAAAQTMSYGLWPHTSVALSLSSRHHDGSSRALPEAAGRIYTHVVQTGRPLRLATAELAQQWEQHETKVGSVPLRGILAVPLIGPEGGTMGAIMLSDKEGGEFTPDDEALLIQLAQCASVSIENVARAKVLKETKERLLATHEHANVGIAETDAAGRLLMVNTGFSALTGYSRGELVNRNIFDLCDPECIEAERVLYERQVAGELRTYAIEQRYLRKDGIAAWYSVSATAVFDEKGRFQYSVRVIQDIDQRKRHEQRQALLVRELHHRVRNTLATVQALAGATARSADSIREFTRSFSERISAMARTHALLTEDYWQTVPLRDMVLNELQPFSERMRQRFKLEGPDLHLSADLAVPLSMVLHELTANAARYGALSVRKGSIEVTWDVTTIEGKRRLHLEWIEKNGLPVEPPVHYGFGLTLLHRVFSAQCDAQVRLDFERTGLRCELDAPLVTHRLVPEYDLP